MSSTIDNNKFFWWFLIRDRTSCERAIRNGGIATMISAFITAIFAGIGLFINSSNKQALDYFFNPLNAIDFVLLLILSFFILKRSRIATTLMFCYYAFSMIFIFYNTGKLGGMSIFLIIVYFMAMRGSYIWHKLYKNELIGINLHPNNYESNTSCQMSVTTFPNGNNVPSQNVDSGFQRWKWCWIWIIYFLFVPGLFTNLSSGDIFTNILENIPLKAHSAWIVRDSRYSIKREFLSEQAAKDFLKLLNKKAEEAYIKCKQIELTNEFSDNPYLRCTPYSSRDYSLEHYDRIVDKSLHDLFPNKELSASMGNCILLQGKDSSSFVENMKGCFQDASIWYLGFIPLSVLALWNLATQLKKSGERFKEII